MVQYILLVPGQINRGSAKNGAGNGAYNDFFHCWLAKCSLHQKLQFCHFCLPKSITFHSMSLVSAFFCSGSSTELQRIGVFFSKSVQNICKKYISPVPRSQTVPLIGGPAHTWRIFQTLIHSQIFSGMVHLYDQKMLDFFVSKKIVLCAKNHDKKH